MKKNNLIVLVIVVLVGLIWWFGQSTPTTPEIGAGGESDYGAVGYNFATFGYTINNFDTPDSADCTPLYQTNECRTMSFGETTYDKCADTNTLIERYTRDDSCESPRSKTYYCAAWCRTRPEGYIGGSCVKHDLVCIVGGGNTQVRSGECVCTI